MKLHPVTQLILFAVVLRLAADGILLARTTQVVMFGRLSPLYDAEWANYALGRFAYRFKDVAQTLLYIGSAAWIELLYRAWLHLKDRSLLPHSASKLETSV